MEAKENLVLEKMKAINKELKTAEIAELTGLDKKEVSKIISKLKKQGLIISPKRCYYKAK